MVDEIDGPNIIMPYDIITTLVVFASTLANVANKLTCAASV